MYRIVLFCFLVNSCFCYEPEVTLGLGKVVGLHENIHGKDVNVFLGVPFAKPPVNELRFRKPQPLTEKWQNPLSAKSRSNICVQPKLLYDLGTMSEDCLYLNVWTPVDLQSDFTNNLKSVMVWLHGGAFFIGASSVYKYNASVLSTVGDVVVVTVNYRLGAMGFMYGGNDDMPGNMGLYDQAMALEWIQDNIAYFGGDKNSVTLFGLSAGSMSTVYHLMSPYSQSFFKNAIAMSGVSIENLLTDSTSTATKIRNTVAKRFGCTNEFEETVSEATLKCLREIDAQKFVSPEMYDFNEVKYDTFQSWFVPVFGESFIPRDPQLMWKDKEFKRDCNLLIGTVAEEGIVTTIFNSTNMNSNNSWRLYLKEHLQLYGLPKYNIDFEEIEKYYFSGVFGKNEKAIYFKALNDFYFNCPSIVFAEKYSEVNTVYQYFHDFEPRVEFIPYRVAHVGHANDVPFVFGTTDDPEDFKISLEWIKIIATFSKTGKAHWPPYSRTKTGDLITFYYEMKGDEKESEVDVGLRHFECRLWSQFLFKDLLS